MTQNLLESLTPREREILALIAEGDSLAEIAQRLSRSLKTIESHRLSIGRKLNASNRVELAKIAISAGLISLDPSGESGASNSARAVPEVELKWLNEINDRVFGVTGQRYIDQLCLALTSVMGHKHAAVCVPMHLDRESSERYTVSMSEDGRLFNKVVYKMQNTPAEITVKSGECRIDRDLLNQYPDDPVLNTIGAACYYGVRLDTERGASSSVLALLHNEPVEHPDSVLRVLRFFASRTATELDALQQAKEMLRLQRQIEQDRAEGGAAASGERSTDVSPDDDLDLLRLALDRLAGASYIAKLTDRLCEIFGARYAGVSIKGSGKDASNMMLLCLSEEGRQSDIQYKEVCDGPCVRAVQDGFYLVNEGLNLDVAEASFLVQSRAEAYCGVRIEGQTGKPIGTLWVLNDKPFDEPQRLEQIMRFVAPRAGAEVEQILQFEALREEFESMEERLQALEAQIRQLHDKR